MLTSSWQPSPYTFFQLSSQSPVTTLSACPMGNHFGNKITEDELDAVLSRMETDFLRAGKEYDVEIRHAILKIYLDSQSFTISPEWQQYLNDLVDLAEASKIAQNQKGRCGEASK